MYLGDFPTQGTVDFKFLTRNVATAAPATLTGGTVSIYKNNADGTETTTGVTLTADFDSRTGLNHVRVLQSDAFYASQAEYQAVITAGTVAGVSVVGAVVACWSIENRSALRPTTAGRTLDVSAGGEAGLDWANVGSPTTTLNLSGTTVKTATDVETDTQDIQSRLPAALASGNMKVDVLAISGDSTAADNLETMLDGTGGQALSLGKLNLVDLSGSGATINILNAHDGPALAMQASTSGTTGVLDIKCNGTGPAVHWYGGDYSIRLDTLGDGIWIDTVPGKACIRLVPPGSGSAITFEQGSAFTGPMIQGSIDFENFVDNMIDAGSLASDTITAAKIATGAVDADALAADAANEIADALLDRTDGVETSVTPRGALRAILATTTGVITDAATTTNTFKNPAGTTTRVTSTVESDGDRTAITLNV